MRALLWLWFMVCVSQLASFSVRRLVVPHVELASIRAPTFRKFHASLFSVSVQGAGAVFCQHALPRVIFVLGGPASGKGTQCLKLSHEFGMKHLSAGELLREEQLSGSDDGKLIDAIIKEGKIVPVQITLNLLKRAIVNDARTCNRFLIDGFPRNWDNLHGWEGSMADTCLVEAVMFIDCPETELEKRLLHRGLTSGRSDDNLATAKKRFQTFYAATMPIVEHFESKNLLIRVRGDASIDDVYAQLREATLPLIAAAGLSKAKGGGVLGGSGP